MAEAPLGIRFIGRFSRDQWYRTFTLIFTFLLYTTFHMSRKPISIVKAELHRNCSNVHEMMFSDNEHPLKEGPWGKGQNDTWCDWAPFNHKDYKQLLGALDYSFLGTYAIGMYFSGVIGERLPLRCYLAVGMLASGFFTALFGLGYFWKIHSLGFYIFVQLANGLVQTTGWPSVVACVGNWFGKGKRGLIMGVWNSHTSVGNIMGSLVAGAWVTKAWGWSFVVPGIIIAVMGIVCWLFLIEDPRDVDCVPPQHQEYLCDRRSNEDYFSIQNEDLDRECLIRSGSAVDLPTQDQAYGSVGTRGFESNFPTDSEVLDGVARPAKAISFLHALQIPGVIEFSLCLFFAKLVSYTFLFWLPMYISSKAHLSPKDSGNMSTLFDVGGLIGGILAGILSDYFGGRATICGAMLVVAAPMLYVYDSVGYTSTTTMISLLILCGILVNGPYSLITTAVSADLGTHKSLKGNSKALSTVTAIIDGTGSVGAALGPLLAGLISPMGWDWVFYMLMAADGFACLFLSRLIYKELNDWCGTGVRGSKDL
uniref:Sugar phosphate exchanger 3 n=1 Tax=Eptatretus burgeri TaxID=7764 RepID=A0A8C4QS63_EPTBU